MSDQGNNQEITVALIAGGKSTRFGSQKAYATLNGVPLIRYSIEIAKQVSQNVIIIAANNRDFCEFNYPVYADIIPECGPIGGLYTALTYAKTSTVATLPCDLPLLPSQVYIILQRFQQRNRPVVAVSHKGVEPLIALWPKSSLAEVERSIHQNTFKLYALLKKMRAIEVSLPETMAGYVNEWFVNVNTRNDLNGIEPVTNI